VMESPESKPTASGMTTAQITKEQQRIAEAAIADIHNDQALYAYHATSDHLKSAMMEGRVADPEVLVTDGGIEKVVNILRGAREIVKQHMGIRTDVICSEAEERAQELLEFEACTIRRKDADGEFKIFSRNPAWVVQGYKGAHVFQRAMELFRSHRDDGRYDHILRQTRGTVGNRQKVIIPLEELDPLITILRKSDHPDAADVAQRLESASVSTPWMDKMRGLAVSEHEVEGELEIDEAATVSYAPGEGGAYVMAFVWVGDSGDEEAAKKEGEENQEDLLRQHHRVDSGQPDPTVSAPDGHPDSDG